MRREGEELVIKEKILQKKDGNKWEVLEGLALITQIAMAMMVSMGISIAIGYWLDDFFGTKFCIVIMVFIGIGAAIKSMFNVTKGFYSKQTEDGAGEGRKKDSD